MVLFVQSFWVTVGIICLILALIGVILPLVPTTPLVILAAYCFSKGSPRLHKWLHENRLFGPLLYDWEKHGTIRTRYKIMATLAIVLLFGLTLILTDTHPVVKILLALLALSVLAYIWTRPSEVGISLKSD